MEDDIWIYSMIYTEFQVDDVQFIQPCGFVWFGKPKYRVKAKSRKKATNSPCESAGRTEGRAPGIRSDLDKKISQREVASEDPTTAT